MRNIKPGLEVQANIRGAQRDFVWGRDRDISHADLERGERQRLLQLELLVGLGQEPELGDVALGWQVER